MSPIGIIRAEYDMDSGFVYARFITGDIVLIDCDKVEDVIADQYGTYGENTGLSSVRCVCTGAW